MAGNLVPLQGVGGHCYSPKKLRPQPVIHDAEPCESGRAPRLSSTQHSMPMQTGPSCGSLSKWLIPLTALQER